MKRRASTKQHRQTAEALTQAAIACALDLLPDPARGLARQQIEARRLALGSWTAVRLQLRAESEAAREAQGCEPSLECAAGGVLR
jgi:hypothetical protein